MSHKLLDLQALRALACLLVVAFHLQGHETRFSTGHHLLRPLASFGDAGVDVFFVLSGFLITFAHARQLGERSALRSYLARRLGRIYPAYAVCFVASAGLFHFVWESCYYPGYFRHAFWSLLLLPQQGPNLVLPQAWTLTYEVMFYLTFAGLFLVPRRWACALLATWAAATALAAVLLWPATRHCALLPLHPLTLEFLLGCAAAGAVRRGWGQRPGLLAALGAAGFTAGAAVLMLEWIGDPNDPRWRVVLFGVPSALLVWGLARREVTRAPLLPAWLRPVGDASYAIYLTHMLALGAFARLGVWTWVSPWPLHLALLAGQFAAACALGYLYHVGVERPLLDWMRRPRRRAERAPRLAFSFPAPPAAA